jgi:hypothetical protein
MEGGTLCGFAFLDHQTPHPMGGTDNWGFPTRLATEADLWARLVGRLLNGQNSEATFHLYGDEPEPPPYPLTDETASALFGRSFRLVNAEAAAADSVPAYQGKER